MLKWSCFCDESYFHKWAIQHKDRKAFTQAIHVNTKEEAEFLVERLNLSEQLIDGNLRRLCAIYPHNEGCHKVDCDWNGDWIVIDGECTCGGEDSSKKTEDE